jgi:hypothetical protein
MEMDKTKYLTKDLIKSLKGHWFITIKGTETHLRISRAELIYVLRCQPKKSVMFVTLGSTTNHFVEVDPFKRAI